MAGINSIPLWISFSWGSNPLEPNKALASMGAVQVAAHEDGGAPRDDVGRRCTALLGWRVTCTGFRVAKRLL